MQSLDKDLVALSSEISEHIGGLIKNEVAIDTPYRRYFNSLFEN